MQIDVPTSLGPGRLTVAAASTPHAMLWLGHGAGGGIDALDLEALAIDLPGRGVTVVRYEQPWRIAGKRIASRPPQLDVAWNETADAVRDLAGTLPIVTGGRSAGARVACRTAASVGAVGVVCLAFPLHPPGKPERSRADELTSAGVPALVLQGDRDTFGAADDVADAIGATDGIRVVPVPGADHSMKTLKSSGITRADVGRLVCDEVDAFVRSLV